MLKTKKFAIEVPRHGEVTTRHVEGAIVDTTYIGHCGRALVASVLAITPEVLAEVPGTCWLLDLTGATTVESDCRIPGAEILRLFREGGGDRFAVVVKSGSLRMVLAAVGFAARLPLKLFEDRASAMEFLRSRPSTRKGDAGTATPHM